MTTKGTCLRHATRRSMKVADNERLQFCVCGATRVVKLRHGVDARVAGAIVSATPWVVEQNAVEDEALARAEAAIDACKCCRHARRDSFMEDPRTCEECGHANEPWTAACHECGAEIEDPAPMPGWMAEDAKADEDYDAYVDDGDAR